MERQRFVHPGITTNGLLNGLNRGKLIIIWIDRELERTDSIQI